MLRLTTIIFGSLLMVCWPETSLANRLPTVSDSIETVLSTYSSFDFQKMIKERLNNESASPISEDDRATIAKLKELSQDIEAIRSTLFMPEELYSKVEYEISSFFKLVHDIDFFFLHEYLKMLGREPDNYSLQSFVNFTTLYQFNLYNGGLLRNTFKMHSTLRDFVYNFKHIVDHQRSDPVILCTTSKSPQEWLKDLYDIVLKSHTQTLLIRKFSFTLKEHYEKQSFEFTRSEDLKEFKEEVNKTYNIVKAGMEEVPRFLYRCDPEKYEEGVNFEKLDPVLQTHIVLAVDLPNDSGGQCKVKKDKHRYNSVFSQQLEVSKRCEEGFMRDCQPFGPKFEVCYSDKSSPRLYDWADFNRDMRFGYQSESHFRCEAKKVGLPGFMKYLNYCLCTCDSGRREQDRYFSLRRVESDTLNNKIVTGVQLVKKRRVFYLMIQEGEFGYNGTIKGDPVWTDVPKFEDDVQERKENTDFHKNHLLYSVTYDSRNVQLDEVTVGKNEVITGIKFSRSGNDLILEIRATPCDYDNGTLKVSESYWINGTAFQGVRQEVLLDEPEVPITSNPKADWKIAGNHQFVRFRTTDNRKDLGQNTVPFFDTQPIATKPPMPLTGAGFILKHKGYSGGFLGLQLQHYNLLN